MCSVNGRMRHASQRSSSTGRQLSRTGKILSADGLPGPSKRRLSLRRATREPGPYPFDDPRSLELGDRAEDVHLELAGRRRGVDALGQTHERNAERLQLLQQRDQVLQVASESIKPPANQHVKPSTLGIGQELVESGATILRPADAAIDVLDCRPAPSARRSAATPRAGSLVPGRRSRPSRRSPPSRLHLSVESIDAHIIASGEAAVLGTVPAGVFPRELRVTEDQKTLLLTNFGSKNLAMIDIARLPLDQREK